MVPTVPVSIIDRGRISGCCPCDACTQTRDGQPDIEVSIADVSTTMGGRSYIQSQISDGFVQLLVLAADGGQCVLDRAELHCHTLDHLPNTYCKHEAAVIAGCTGTKRAGAISTSTLRRRLGNGSAHVINVLVTHRLLYSLPLSLASERVYRAPSEYFSRTMNVMATRLTSEGRLLVNARVRPRIDVHVAMILSKSGRHLVAQSIPPTTAAQEQ